MISTYILQAGYGHISPVVHQRLPWRLPTHRGINIYNYIYIYIIYIYIYNYTCILTGAYECHKGVSNDMLSKFPHI